MITSSRSAADALSRIAFVALLAIVTAIPSAARKKQTRQSDPAQNIVKTTTVTVTETTFADGSVATTTSTDTVFTNAISLPKPQAQPNKLHNDKGPDPFGANGSLKHFTWGVELGSGLDLTAHDMTMFEISAAFGYKNEWVRFAGVGASILSMMNNSSRCYPVYAMVRTSFTPYFSPCFLEARAGASFNSLLNYGSQTDFYGSLGVGFTLAHSRKFTSHIVLRGVVMPLRPVTVDDRRYLDYTVAYASLAIGCAF